MNCPVCKDVTLQMTDRQGVEIDYCPRCRGIWLDRGELDKIIERMSDDDDRNRPAPPPRDSDRRDDYHRKDDYDYKKKRKSILGEIFDF